MKNSSKKRISEVSRTKYWLDNLEERVCKVLSELFGERGEGGKYETVVSSEGVTIPKDIYPDEEITVRHLEDVVIPITFQDYVYDVYFKTTNEVLEKILPSRGKGSLPIRVTLKMYGLKAEELVQEQVYRHLEVGVHTGTLVERSNLKIIQEGN